MYIKIREFNYLCKLIKKIDWEENSSRDILSRVNCASMNKILR